MSWIDRKGVHQLMEAGFSEEEIGLVDGGKLGVTIYESPEDYFAYEMIDNLKESGEIDLYDDPSAPLEGYKEQYDTSHPGIYADNEYPGNDDPYENTPVELRSQVEWLKGVKLGRLALWQRKSKRGQYEWQVKGLTIDLPEEEQVRYAKMSDEYKKLLWKAYAKDEWKELWIFCAQALRSIPICDKQEITTMKGSKINLLVIEADKIRELGYEKLMPETKYISMIYFNKDK